MSTKNMITVYINLKGGFHYIKGRDFFSYNGKAFDLQTVNRNILLWLSKEVKARRLIQTDVRGLNIKNEVSTWRQVHKGLIAEYGK